jgi:hypothetical protein
MHAKARNREDQGIRKKLLRDDVFAILSSPDARAKDLAERFGVSSQLIGDVRKGRAYRAVSEEFRNNQIRD